MPLETAKVLSQLNPNYPAGTDPIGQGDDHIRMLKEVLRGSVQANLRESLRRSYADAGYTLVSGSFEQGGTVTTGYELLWHEETGEAYQWGGVFPITVSAGTVPAPPWVSYSTVTLGQAISKPFGISKVYAVETWGDDSTGRAGSSVYPFKTIAAALAAGTGPAILLIGEGLFTWGGTLRNNIAVIGTSLPAVNEDSTALVGGTVLQSGDSAGFPGGFTGMSGLLFDNFGVLARGKSNGFQIASPGSTAVGKHIRVSRLLSLCDPTTDHAILLENLQYLEMQELVTYGGVSGCAIKALDFTGDSFTHYDASGAGCTLRESPYAKCRRGRIRGVRTDKYTSTANAASAVQILNNEEGSAMEDIAVSGITGNGANVALFVNGQNNTVPAKGIDVTDIQALQSSSFSAYITGNLEGVRVRKLSTNNCVGIAHIEASGGYAPRDTVLEDIVDMAGPQSAVRPILNEGIRTSIKGFKTNLHGRNIYNPVIENPGVDLVLSGFDYTGVAVIDTGSGYHTILEGEDLQGLATGSSTPGTCYAVKRANGQLSVNIVNAIVTGAITDIVLPSNMRFKPGDVLTPAQIRQNYNIKISYYVNATSPIPVNMSILAFPLSENSFRVVLSGDSSAIATGAVISAELTGIWK